MLMDVDYVWLEAECSRYEFFLDVAKQAAPDIGIIAFNSDEKKVIELMQRLSQEVPDCSLLVVGDTSDSSLILKAFRAGAKEFLSKPLQLDDLLTALRRIGSPQKSSGQNTGGNGVSVAVAGALGGIGTTTLAVNLGCRMASYDGSSSVLIDLDMALGDADIFLDMIPEYTLVDVSQNVSRLDLALLKRSLEKHESGLLLLPRPNELADLPFVTPESIERALNLIKASFSHLVFDLSKGYNTFDVMALQLADVVLVVTQLDVPSLRNTMRLLSWLETIEGVKEKVKVVSNRTGASNNQISLKKAQESLECKIDWTVPNEARPAIEARDFGSPLMYSSPKSPLTKAIEKIADDLCGMATEEKKEHFRLGKIFKGLQGNAKKKKASGESEEVPETVDR
jgi:pilus assembly protein CpaE